ncbi:MAG: N-acetylmuramoyl-L-alanine amidase [Anaerolineales bacterium]|nr:N-acetylmuramoyl-L-alanine amidase [Anaerolineales bacterium]
MNPSPATPRSPRRPRWRNLESFVHIQTVLLVAAVLATLFTAWTDPGLLPGALGDRITINFSDSVAPPPGAIGSPTPRSRPLIGLVAGHSGNDSGAVCADGLTEVSINTQIVAYVQKYLSEKGIDVEVLKEFDDRLDSYQALALISIHTDSCDYVNDQATGFKVASTLSNPHPERSARLVSCLRNRYAQATGLSLHNSITNDMTYYHAFDEINNETTAVIIEIGFMNLDRQLLTEHPDVVASGITNGVMCFINNENIAPQPTP